MTKQSNIYLAGSSSPVKDLLWVHSSGLVGWWDRTQQRARKRKGKDKGKCGQEINPGKGPGTKRSDGLQEAAAWRGVRKLRAFPKGVRTTAGARGGLSPSCSPDTRAARSPSCGREAAGRWELLHYVYTSLCAKGSSKTVDLIARKHLTSRDRGLSTSGDAKKYICLLVPRFSSLDIHRFSSVHKKNIRYSWISPTVFNTMV